MGKRILFDYYECIVYPKVLNTKGWKQNQDFYLFFIYKPLVNIASKIEAKTGETNSNNAWENSKYPSVRLSFTCNLQNIHRDK